MEGKRSERVGKEQAGGEGGWVGGEGFCTSALKS